MAVTDFPGLADVFHRNGLSATGVIGDGQHAQGNVFHPALLDEPVQGFDIHVAFEGVFRFRAPPFFNDQVDRVRALGLHVGPGGVEMRVVGYRVRGLGDDREQDAFRGPALVCGDQVFERHQVFHRLFETVERRAAGVGFVALHDRAPLPGAHAGGAGIGQQVDQHVIRVQCEQVVVSSLDALFPLLAGGHADGFYGFDSKGFYVVERDPNEPTLSEVREMMAEVEEEAN